jgi:hypothetical protein
MSIKEDVHRLVDELPESDLEKVLHPLEMMRAAKRDPFLQALMDAPIDDEPTTPEEDAGAVEARQELRRGEGKTLNECAQSYCVADSGEPWQIIFAPRAEGSSTGVTGDAATPPGCDRWPRNTSETRRFP